MSRIGSSDSTINQPRLRDKEKEPSFYVKCRVEIDMDVNLALELGDFIVNHGCDNQAIMALGFRLRDLVPYDKP